MSTPYRKTEVALVADLLAEPAESVEELAWTVIQALDEDRRKRDSYVVRIALQTDDGVVWGVGPYPTQKRAQEVAEALRTDLPKSHTHGAVVRLIRPSVIEEDLAPKIASHCIECRHPMAAHDWPKSKIRGCVVAGCSCGKPVAVAA